MAEWISIHTLGAPRSGTIYISNLLTELYGRSAKYPRVEIKPKGHDCEHARWAILNNITDPYVIPFRDPYQSIASDIIGSDEPFNVEDRNVVSFDNIGNLTALWEYVLSSDLFIPIPFEVFTTNPSEVSEKMERKYPELRGLSKNVSNEEVLNTVLTRDMETYANDPHGLAIRGHVPRPNQLSKVSILEELQKPTFSRRMSYLSNMREELLERYGLI